MRPHRYDDGRYAPSSGEGEWRRRSGSRTARAAAKSLFESKAARAAFPVRRKPSTNSCAHWDEKVGSPVKLMGIVGPMADLIIAHRPARTGGIADLFLGAALHESERPVLILPRSGPARIGSRICIGWNQSPEAARTVASVMPLIAAADEVSIVVCGPEDRAGPKSGQLVHYLGHYGVKADVVHTRGRHIEEELLQSYKKLGANLLVTGAYSKSRWQEKIFGGTTEWLVRKSKLPVLMQQG
jgi:nucleotide-binding universal stress UspA family protein